MRLIVYGVFLVPMKNAAAFYGATAIEYSSLLLLQCFDLPTTLLTIYKDPWADLSYKIIGVKVNMQTC